MKDRNLMSEMQENKHSLCHQAPQKYCEKGKYFSICLTSVRHDILTSSVAVQCKKIQISDRKCDAKNINILKEQVPILIN